MACSGTASGLHFRPRLIFTSLTIETPWTVTNKKSLNTCVAVNSVSILFQGSRRFIVQQGEGFFSFFLLHGKIEVIKALNSKQSLDLRGQTFDEAGRPGHCGCGGLAASV